MKSFVHLQPMQEFNSLPRQMNRLFVTLSGKTPSLLPFEENPRVQESHLPVDIYDDGQRLTKVEVPGIDEKDIKIEVKHNVLTVHGERKLDSRLIVQTQR